MAFVDVSREEIAYEKEQRGEMEMSGAVGDGRWRGDIPSGELVSTMLTLVWAIAGICCVGSKRGGRSSCGVALRDRICRETC
jgi:hypothetical protein